MAVCENYLKIAYTVVAPKKALLTRLRCKRWSCAYCAEKNARMWQYWLIKRLPEVSDEWWLMTLTAPPNVRGRVESLEAIRGNIDRLIKRMKRVFGEGIEYVRVFEKHPTSEAVHAHFIVTGVTPYVAIGCSVKLQEMAMGVLTRNGRNGVWAVRSWLKKVSWEVGMGYIADIKKFVGDNKIAAFYVTKYLTKDQQAIDVPYLRHVQVTKGIGSPEFEKNYQWTPASYITARTFEEPNTEITDIDTGKVIDNNFWEHTGFYPNDV